MTFTIFVGDGNPPKARTLMARHELYARHLRFLTRANDWNSRLKPKPANKVKNKSKKVRT
jgi:hypothetical protein